MLQICNGSEMKKRLAQSVYPMEAIAKVREFVLSKPREWVASSANSSRITLHRNLTRKDGMNQGFYEDLCKGLGIDPSTGESIRLAKARTAHKLAEETASYRPAREKRIPIVGRVQAGRPGAGADAVRIQAQWVMDGEEHPDLDESRIVYVSTAMYESVLRAPNHPVYGCVVEGTSMTPDYMPGDVVLVERFDDPRMLRSGDHVVIDLTGSGEYTLKIYNKKGKALVPLNTRDNHDIYRFEDYAAMRLWGRVCGLFRTRK